MLPSVSRETVRKGSVWSQEKDFICVCSKTTCKSHHVVACMKTSAFYSVQIIYIFSTSFLFWWPADLIYTSNWLQVLPLQWFSWSQCECKHCNMLSEHQKPYLQTYLVLICRGKEQMNWAPVLTCSGKSAKTQCWLVRWIMCGDPEGQIIILAGLRR